MKFGNHGIRWIPNIVFRFPIPANPPASAEREIESLVDQILAAKAADATADTSALERKIDQEVYRLYGLTDDEIAIVEKGNVAADEAPSRETAKPSESKASRRDGPPRRRPSILDEDEDIL